MKIIIVSLAIVIGAAASFLARSGAPPVATKAPRPKPGCVPGTRTIPDDLVARTPFGTRDALDEFLRGHRAEVNHLEEDLWDGIAQPVNDAEICLRRLPSSARSYVLEWKLHAARDSYRLEAGELHSSDGIPRAPSVDEQRCLAPLLARSFRGRAANDRGFYDYAGPYPMWLHPHGKPKAREILAATRVRQTR